ncbi:hypothetical protein PTKIN_Ptkin08bG0205900 [Pterospermum kingtungense]
MFSDRLVSSICIGAATGTIMILLKLLKDWEDLTEDCPKCAAKAKERFSSRKKW